VTVGKRELVVKNIFKDFDLALIKLPNGSIFEVIEFGSAEVLEAATLVNDMHVIKCKVINAGASLLYLLFSISDMPQSEDSGSPMLQVGKVIGLLSSITLNNCMGTAISTEQFPKLFGSTLK
jgi:hypothetical protein